MKKRNIQGDKARGKRRRLRDNGGKLELPGQEQIQSKHAAYNSTNDEKKLKSGVCEDISCGSEAACLQHDENTYYCLCTINGQVLTDGNKCPRNTVPVTPKPIHNVMPPQRNSTDARYVPSSLPTPTHSSQIPKSLVSQNLHPGSTASSDSGSISAGLNNSSRYLLAAVTVSGALLLVLISVIFVICYLKRRTCIKDGKTQPRVRHGEPLLAERYITNPQYGLCGAGATDLAEQLPTTLRSAFTDACDTKVPILERSALTFLEEIGEGCFGKVHKGLLRTSVGEDIVAIKVLKESAGRSAEEDFMREVTIMSSFRHPNILALIGVVHREEIRATPLMLFEYMEWGDLAGVLRGSRGGGREGPVLDDSALLQVAIQVARGMQYLASCRFVHRDLAARNCLVGTHLTVKIADFGMSRDVYISDYYKMGGDRPMPVRWMSPESIVYARFTHESDIWSYGVVLWEIYSRGKQPFYGQNNYGATRLILQGIILVPPEDSPKFACELMRACWKTDPRERISFDEICKKLETAVEANGSIMPIRLPRPPSVPPQDSAGYLVPARGISPDYLATLPDPKPTDTESEPDTDYDDEFPRCEVMQATTQYIPRFSPRNKPPYSIDVNFPPGMEHTPLQLLTFSTANQEV